MKFYLSGDKPHVYKNLLNDLANLDNTKKWVVTIKEGKDNKTTQQRNYYHKLLDLISEESGFTVEQLKTRGLFARGHTFFVTLKCGRVVEQRLSTEKLNKEQYSNIIEDAQTMCKCLKIKYPPPKFYGME